MAADIAIRRAGFTLFAPSLWKSATPARRDATGTMRPGKRERIVPLFPRYMFVTLNLADPGWHAVKVSGVECVMSGAGATPGAPRIPTPVPDGAIEWLRGLPGFEANGCFYPPGQFGAYLAPPIAVGTPVRLADGPFADIAGICQWSDTRRVHLLLGILGREVRFDAARADVLVG